MLYKIKLKNSDDYVLVDDSVYEWLSNDPYFKQISLIDNFRKHSCGCAVFQKTWSTASNTYKTETIYLHKLIAERYLAHQKTGKNTLVGTQNGNKLDCRLANLEYRSRAKAGRQRKPTSKTGYTGVYQEHRRYRAIISVEGKSIHLGMYDTAEEAALAYNAKSREIFGSKGKINAIRIPTASRKK